MNFEYNKKQKVVLISDFSEAGNLFFCTYFQKTSRIIGSVEI